MFDGFLWGYIFLGNLFGCVVVCEVIRIICEEGLVENVWVMGDWLRVGLE